MRSKYYLLAMVEHTLTHNGDAVLCTVVRVKPDTDSQLGNRLLLTSHGEQAGYLGCDPNLECQLKQCVWETTEFAPALFGYSIASSQLVEAKSTNAQEHDIFVFCKRLQFNDHDISALKTAVENQQTQKLALVYRSNEPQFPVGSLIDHSHTHKVSDSNFSSPVVTKHIDNSSQSHSVSFCASDGREIEMLIEVVDPPEKLVIFGQGHDVQSLIKLALSMNWNITVVSSSTPNTIKRRFPNVQFLSENSRDLETKLSIDPRCLCLIMTHDFHTDCAILTQLLPSCTPFIGISGSKRRFGEMVASLYRQGKTISAHDARRIRSPVGLDIGATGVEEVAISIISELIAFSRDRQGTSLHRSFYSTSCYHQNITVLNQVSENISI